MIRLISLIALFVLSLSAIATPVGPLNYQGRLLDNQGVPVTGSYNFVIRIYDDVSAGTLQYQETINGVNVNDGVYSFRIGTAPVPDVGTWDLNLWQSNLNDLFLEVEVDSEVLAPRYELTSSPHAFTATLALSAESLGAKTAAEFDNILEGICITSRGKWLDLVNTCLGVGATVTGETLATMLSNSLDTDFTDLDLSKADVTSSSFDGVNFSGTVFKNTQVSMAGFTNTNLTGAVLDGVTSNNALPNTAINLTNATLTNMSLQGWDLSNADITGLSAANLTACPSPSGLPNGSLLPANWECREMRASSGLYFLAGPGVNLSAISAAAVQEFGVNYLEFDPDVFLGLDLNGANFSGLDVRQDFALADLSNADFRSASIARRNDFTGANLTNADFTGATIDRVSLLGATLTNTIFAQTRLTTVEFDDIDGISFAGATIINASFQAISNTSFDYAFVEGLLFAGWWTGTITFTNAEVFNGINLPDLGVYDAMTGWEPIGNNATVNFEGTKFNAFPDRGVITANIGQGITYNFNNVTFKYVQFEPRPDCNCASQNEHWLYGPDAQHRAFSITNSTFDNVLFRYESSPGMYQQTGLFGSLASATHPLWQDNTFKVYEDGFSSGVGPYAPENYFENNVFELYVQPSMGVRVTGYSSLTSTNGINQFDPCDAGDPENSNSCVNLY